MKIRSMLIKAIAIPLTLTVAAHATVYEKVGPGFGEIAPGFTATSDAPEMRCLLQDARGMRMEIYYRKNGEDRSLSVLPESEPSWAWLTPEMQVLITSDGVEEMLVLSPTVPFHIVVDQTAGKIMGFVYDPVMPGGVQAWTPTACEDYEVVGAEAG